jgi:hypothetical protein
MNNDDFAAILHCRASGDEVYQTYVIVSKSELHDAARRIQDGTTRLRKICYSVLDCVEAKALHDRARELLEEI